MIRQKIMESGETPKLLVLLGDHTSDISHYERAWVLSSEKSFESQLRLGTHYYQRQDVRNFRKMDYIMTHEWKMVQTHSYFVCLMYSLSRLPFTSREL